MADLEIPSGPGGVCRVGDTDTEGGAVENPMNSTVYANGKLVAVINAKLSEHEDIDDGTISMGDSTVQAEGNPVTFLGAKTTCGHSMKTASENVITGKRQITGGDENPGSLPGYAL